MIDNSQDELNWFGANFGWDQIDTSSEVLVMD